MEAVERFIHLTAWWTVLLQHLRCPLHDDMSRRRKLQQNEGDRSHIPREERSYVEYHPRLLTHLALTLVRQATKQHRRTQSRVLSSARNSISTQLESLSEVKETTQNINGVYTPSESLSSTDMHEFQKDKLYAFGQITIPNGLDDTPYDAYAERAGNLFEVNPAFDLERDATRHAHAVEVSGDLAIDPALLDEQDDVTIPLRLDATSALPTAAPTSPTEPTELGHVTAPEAHETLNKTASMRNGTTQPPSDRYLRSEVSVEEKYERLQREEGFSLGKLHEPKFRKLDSLVLNHKVRLTSNAIAFGYQADHSYEHPEGAYLRAINVSESDLTDRVEYDMDEQDDHWLEKYNERRRLRDEDTVSREIFEITLTKIEKEWTALEKRIPKAEKKVDAASEDAKCAICDDGECEITNAIVFCDGCNLAVHQGWYSLCFLDCANKI